MQRFEIWGEFFPPAWMVEAGGTMGSVIAPDFPFWHYLVKVLAILSAMVGALLLVLSLWKRWAPRYQRHPALIRILATHYLAPKQALILVAVGREQFLVASSSGNLSVMPLTFEKLSEASSGLPAPLES